MTKFDKERITDLVLNIISHNRECCDEYMCRMITGYYSKVSNNKHIEAHKEAFGPQSYCWNGEYRFWVWDFNTWRVYVSNQQGVSIEVEYGTSLEDTMNILRAYWNKIGV